MVDVSTRELDWTLLVQFQDDLDEDSIDAHFAAIKKYQSQQQRLTVPTKIRRVGRFEAENHIQGYIAEFGKNDGQCGEWKAWLEMQMGVKEVNYDLKMGLDADSTATDSWALGSLSDVPGTYKTDSERRGEGVIIHILDDGYKPIISNDADAYNYVHPDSNGNNNAPPTIWDIQESRIHSFHNITGSDRLHGFRAATCAAGSAFGTAPNASIWMHKVTEFFDIPPGKVKLAGPKNESCPRLSLILEAFDDIAKDMSTRNLPRVINCSWGLKLNEISNPIGIIKDALGKMIDKGCIIVASAGNHGANVQDGQIWPVEPESEHKAKPRVLVVGASDKVGGIWEKHDIATGKKEGGSNFGPLVHVYAPGTALPMYGKIAKKSGAGYIETMNGTSFAAPLVSGIVACILSDYLANKIALPSAAEMVTIIKDHYSTKVQVKKVVEDLNPKSGQKNFDTTNTINLVRSFKQTP